MTWVMLSYDMSNDVEEVPQRDGKYKLQATGQQISKLVLLDTAKDKITEVEYRIMDGVLTEREPTFAERQAVKNIFKTEMEDPIAKKKIAQQEQFIRDYRRKETHLKREITELNQEIKRLSRYKGKPPKEQQQKNDQRGELNAAEQDQVIAAIEARLNWLALDGQWIAHSKLAPIYTKMTGMEAPRGEDLEDLPDPETDEYEEDEYDDSDLY